MGKSQFDDLQSLWENSIDVKVLKKMFQVICNSLLKTLFSARYARAGPR